MPRRQLLGLIGAGAVAVAAGRRIDTLWRNPTPAEAGSTSTTQTTEQVQPPAVASTTTTEKLSPKAEYEPGAVFGSLTINTPGRSVEDLSGLTQSVFWDSDSASQEDPNLLNGVGLHHYKAAPGEAGNAVIFGHRVTDANHPFRHIDQLQTGDSVSVTNAKTGEAATYTFASNQVVDPVTEEGQAAIFDPPQPEGQKMLTIYACHPPGSDAERFVARFIAE